MHSTCIIVDIGTTTAAFPFAHPGPHEDTLLAFRRIHPTARVGKVVDWADFRENRIDILGFRGAFVEELA